MDVREGPRRVSFPALAEDRSAISAVGPNPAMFGDAKLIAVAAGAIIVREAEAVPEDSI